MRKKILIIGHERSGTHFLTNTIAQCFDYDHDTINLVHTQGVDWNNSEASRNWMRQFRGQFVRRIFKSHHSYPFIAPLLSELSEEFIVFYVQRDGRDVMTSFWTYLNRIPGRGWGPRESTVGHFMRAISTGRFTQFQATRRPITMLERWVEHVEGWSKKSPRIHRVSYETLHADHDNVIDRISEAVEQTPVARVRPTLDAPSSLPWKGSVGTWREFFTDADVRYFNRTAGMGPVGRMLPRPVTRFAGNVIEQLLYANDQVRQSNQD